MKIIYLSLLFVVFFSVACKKEDVAPLQQQIVTNDTSSTSGELTVDVKYIQNSTVFDAGQNVNVRLYATYEDLKNDLFIYNLNTSDRGIAYFGFINIGTYYVYSEYQVNGSWYKKESAVQIRSQRTEKLTITLQK